MMMMPERVDPHGTRKLVHPLVYPEGSIAGAQHQGAEMHQGFQRLGERGGIAACPMSGVAAGAVRTMSVKHSPGAARRRSRRGCVVATRHHRSVIRRRTESFLSAWEASGSRSTRS